MTALAVILVGGGFLLVWAGITDTNLWGVIVSTFAGTSAPTGTVAGAVD